MQSMTTVVRRDNSIVFPFIYLLAADGYEDIERERSLPRAERGALLKKRIHWINEYTTSVEYLVQFCPYPIVCVCFFLKLSFFFFFF